MKTSILAFFLATYFLGSCQMENTNAIYQEIYDLSAMEYDSIEAEIGHYIETGNVRMHYTTFGDPSHTPLLWVHGTGSSAWELLSFRDSLEELELYVISIDYYGHGQTPMPKTEKSIYHIADDIHFLLDHLNIEKTLIGGWSRGGYIASAFYADYSEYVSGVILVDGGSANALVPRYQMDRDTLKAKYMEAEIPDDLLQTFDTKYDAFCSMVDTSFFASQSWILDGLKIGSDGKWGFNSDVWPAVANESVEAMLSSVESPTLAPLLASSTYLMEPMVIYRNLSVPLIIIDPVKEGETWQNYTPENEKLKNLHPDLIVHRIYEDTDHHAHFQQRDLFFRDMKLLIELSKAQK